LLFGIGGLAMALALALDMAANRVRLRRVGE